MLIKPVEITLKDGRKALIRSPRDEDIPGMLEYLRLSAQETDFLLRTVEDCEKYTPEGEKELFDQINASGNGAMLVCLVNGRVAGDCDIKWSDNLKTRHRAEIGIALLREYWNLGIGTRLFEQMIRIAEESENVLQLELEFVEGNTRARALYEKMGFRICGIRPNAVRTRDGELKNEYVMIREIKR